MRRRYTHKANQPYRYSRWTDRSDDIRQMGDVLNQPLLRLSTVTNNDFTVNAKCSYVWQKDNFFTKNQKDQGFKFMDKSVVGDDNGFYLVYNSRKGGMSAKRLILNTYVYGLLSLIGFSWVVRVYLIRSTKRLEYSYNRLFIE